MNLYSKMETDSQIQKVNEQLPVNRGKGERTDRGMELRDTVVYKRQQECIVQHRKLQPLFGYLF